ncbi:type II secretion system protein [bacterium]|nr:type II secretion system protein [bacterium]
MFAFTLAEVLITLVIIGVIAAITVPSLINKTNNQEYVSRLKKAYSVLSQATNSIIREEGPVTSWATSLDCIYNLYKKQLPNIKECRTNGGECFKPGNYKKLTGEVDMGNDWNQNVGRKFILADGTQILFWNHDPSCTSRWGDLEIEGKKCIIIGVDVNGLKKPNMYGKDMFFFSLRQTGVFPLGCTTDSCNGTNAFGCACKVLREGAMNY